MPAIASSKSVQPALLAAALMLAGAAPARAQNWEPDHQLRVGAFWQSGRTVFDAADGNVAQSGRTGANGFGLTAGAELLRARGWTFGVEGDFGQSFATRTAVINDPINGATANVAADYFASLRGRIGYEVHPNVVIYGTGGVAFKGISVTEGVGDKAERTLYGGALGLGGEYHHGGTIYFVEYQHDGFRSDPLTTSTTGNTYRVSANSDAVRLGVKFKVGYDNYTDDVRDGWRH